MGWFKEQFRKVIEWKDQGPDDLVYKFPHSDKVEIMNKSVLVVNPGQRALFVQEGKIADQFGPGTYKLDDIKNIPILTQLYHWKYAFESPYKGNIYFISTKQNINKNWGTTNPVIMRDQDFGMVRVRGFGTYSFSIGQPTEAMEELIGAQGTLTTKYVDDYFRKVITSTLSNVIAESEIPALDLSMHYEELSKAAQHRLKDDFENIGIKLNALYIENLSLPEEVEKMMDKRTQAGVMNGAMQGYAQMKALDALENMSKNPSTMGGLGMNIAAGLGTAKLFNSQIDSAMKSESSDNVKSAKCPNCGAQIAAGTKFCPECGNKLNIAKRFCPECGAEVSAKAKFCPECGAKV